MIGYRILVFLVRLLHDETDGSGANLSTASKRCQFKEEVEVNPVVQDNYLSQLRDKYVVRKQEADRRIVEEKIRDRHNSIRVFISYFSDVVIWSRPLRLPMIFLLFVKDLRGCAIGFH